MDTRELDRPSHAADDFLVGNLPKFSDPHRSASVPPGSIPTHISGSEFEPSPRARLRRDSASSSCSSKQFGRSIRKMRVGQIKQESNVFISEESDYEKEKHIVVSSQVASVWSGFSLEDTDGPRQFDSVIGGRIRTNSLTEPVCIICPTNLIASCSPSPSLSEKKQCFSPAMQQIVPSNFAFSPSPSPTPSPTRRNCAYNRSLSPIAMRPVTLGLKRKCDSDTESAAKRLNYGGAISSCATTPDRGVVPTVQHPFLRHSLSVNSLDSESSNSTLSSFDLGLSLVTASNSNGNPHQSGAFGNSVIFSLASIPNDNWSVAHSSLSVLKSFPEEGNSPASSLIPSPLPVSATLSPSIVDPLEVEMSDELMADVSVADQSGTDSESCRDTIPELLPEDDTVQSTGDLSNSSLGICSGDVEDVISSC